MNECVRRRMVNACHSGGHKFLMYCSFCKKVHFLAELFPHIVLKTHFKVRSECAIIPTVIDLSFRMMTANPAFRKFFRLRFLPIVHFSVRVEASVKTSRALGCDSSSICASIKGLDFKLVSCGLTYDAPQMLADGWVGLDCLAQRSAWSVSGSWHRPSWSLSAENWRSAPHLCPRMVNCTSGFQLCNNMTFIQIDILMLGK